MIIICGLPNAGKTTYSKQYDSVLHYDDISRFSFAERNEIYRATNACCVEGIYNTAKSRINLLKHIQRNDERKVCIWIDTPVEVCLERERNYRRRHDGLVLSHAETFEPPTLDEGWDEIIRIVYSEENNASK